MALTFKAVLFDMDGVVVDSMPYHYKAWQSIFDSLGINLDKMDVYKREGEQGIVSISEILEEHGVFLTRQEKQRLLKEKEALFKKMASVRLLPEIESFIQELKKEGCLLALVTGTSRGEINYVLPGRIIKSFDVLVAGDDVKQGKPASDPYKKALEALGLEPGEAVVIENAPYGIESAKKAGLFCIAITSSLPREYLKEADIICDSVEEVQRLLLGDRLRIKIFE